MLSSYLFLGHASVLELCEGEATSSPGLDVVLQGWAPDHRLQGPEGPRGDGGSLGGAGFPPANLAGRLVEPGLDIGVPIFVQMHIGDHLIALGRHLERLFGCNRRRVKMNG